MAKRIYFQSMGEMFGPISGVELRLEAVRGRVKPDTLVRVGDDGEWVPATRLTNLFDAEGHPVGPDGTASLPEKRPRQKESFTLTPARLALAIAAGLLFLVALVGCLLSLW